MAVSTDTIIWLRILMFALIIGNIDGALLVLNYYWR